MTNLQLNQTKKPLKSNGFGSFEQKIVVRVDTNATEAFSEAFDAQPFRSSPDHSDFIIQTSATRRGDDETILYEIDYALPVDVPLGAWSVKWGESSY